MCIARPRFPLRTVTMASLTAVGWGERGREGDGWGKRRGWVGKGKGMGGGREWDGWEAGSEGGSRRAWGTVPRAVERLGEHRPGASLRSRPVRCQRRGAGQRARPLPMTWPLPPSDSRRLAATRPGCSWSRSMRPRSTWKGEQGREGGFCAGRKLVVPSWVSGQAEPVPCSPAKQARARQEC